MEVGNGGAGVARDEPMEAASADVPAGLAARLARTRGVGMLDGRTCVRRSGFRRSAPRHRPRQHRHRIRSYELLRRSTRDPAVGTGSIQTRRDECGAQRLVWPAADRGRGMAPVGVVERGGTEADHRRLPEASPRLVRIRLAPSAQLAVGANGVGLRFYFRRRHLGARYGAIGLHCNVDLETSEGADGSRRDIAAIQAGSVAFSAFPGSVKEAAATDSTMDVTPLILNDQSEDVRR